MLLNFVIKSSAMSRACPVIFVVQMIRSRERAEFLSAGAHGQADVSFQSVYEGKTSSPTRSLALSNKLGVAEIVPRKLEAAFADLFCIANRCLVSGCQRRRDIFSHEKPCMVWAPRGCWASSVWRAQCGVRRSFL